MKNLSEWKDMTPADVWSELLRLQLQEAILNGTTTAVADMRSVMSRAVELAAARVVAPVELPDRFNDVLTDMETCGTKREAQVAITVRGLLRSHADQGATVATLQAKVEELEAYAKTMHATVARVEDERDALRAEVERLKAEVNDKEVARALAARSRDRLREQVRVAESRLAAIREKLTDDAIESWMDEPHDPEPLSDDALLRAFARWLECDAPNSPGFPDGSGDAPQESNEMAVACTCGVALGCAAERHPCSATCTHDDAATPGHPERVKERSEAFKNAMEAAVEDRNSGLLEEGWSQGADDIRGAVEKWAKDYFGSVPPTLKDAMDGAAP